jgi:hypothetical protein
VPAPTVEQQVDAHTLARAALTAQAVDAARSAFDGFDGWYDTAAITKLCTGLARSIEAVQRQQAATTNAYLTRVTRQLTGRRVSAPKVIDVRDLRSGVTHAGVYGRVADYYRWRASEDDDDAGQLAVQRAAVIAETDIDLAFRDMVSAFMESKSDVRGYRRVIRPERSAGGTCGLCVVAADRVYSRDSLLPLHARCKCTVLPITDDSDPGLELNEADFRTLYGTDSGAEAANGTAGRTDAAILKRGRYTVKTHGELGPVLVAARDDFRGPSQVADDVRD